VEDPRLRHPERRLGDHRLHHHLIVTRRACIAVDLDLDGGGDTTATELAADLRRLLTNAQWGWLNPEVTVIDPGEVP
jgi:hypothetical protein